MGPWPEEEQQRRPVRQEEPPTDLWYPGIPDNELPEERAARREAYADAVDATRFNLPVFGTSFDTSALEQLIPPRRSRVQGPATRPGERTLLPGGVEWGEPLQEAEPAQATGTSTSVSRASRIMALGTLASRATGMFRQLLLVYALGTGVFGSDFNVANNVPNTIYLLVIGGAVSSVFVPQLVRAMKDDADGGQAFMDRLLTISMVILGVLTAACVLAAPQIVDFFSSATGPDRTTTIIFARYCLPQIFFYGMFVMLGQILNAKDKFGPMMWTPVLANVIMIATLVAYLVVADTSTTAVTITPAETRLLGIGTTIGIALQTLTLIPYLRQVGVGFRPRFDWRGSGLGKSMTLAKWTMGMVLIGQVTSWVVTKYGTAMDHAYQNQGVGYTAYSNALTIWILPQSIVTVSIITALLPRMSRAAHAGDKNSVGDSISYALRVTAVAIVPCGFAFVAFGQQISALLFNHGATDATMAHNLGYDVMAFGLGLIPFSAQYLMLRGFYAYEDTRTPFMVSLWITGINSSLSLASYYLLNKTVWVMPGMCLAYGFSYTVGMVITARRLNRKLPGMDFRRIIRTHAKLGGAALAASVVGGPVAFKISHVFNGGTIGSATALAVGAAIFIAVFLLVARKMRIEEVDSLLSTIKARFGR
jgi:putative peptidoglycan lipid II flippase